MRSQAGLSKWLGTLPTFTELKAQRIDEREILKMALDGKAQLTREQVKELAYKSSHNGQFFTPEPIANLVASLGDIQKGESVLDPACGLGDLMFAALKYTEHVEGIESMRETSQLACMLGLNMVQQNSLENTIKQYDVVLANPPFGKISEHQVSTWSDFILNKKKRNNRMECLFLELCLRVAKRRVVIIVPDGLLSNSSMQYVRKWVLDNFGYRATISLPRKTFWKSTRERNKWRTPATTTKTSIMVIDKTKPPGDYKIFMAMPKNLEDIDKVAELWTKFIDEQKSVKVCC